ncbi:MAG: bleomycin resistance protein [Planctomycetaceae bacterium]|nr:hypothetical protein [Planctomycetales bacterium]MCB9873255.1 bleomycin resistance protein [Planctomycetaceae bacterium]MCB9939446.1 bleomycin resistance protein [Planctomycetaceae bacterium]HRX77449.1 hypothetical protein [Pirellulaceae bacterium]
MTETNLRVADIRPFIGAKHFDTSRDFYVALGWRVTYDSGDLRVLELAGHRFYLQNYFNKEWCNNTMLHVAVDDVEAWYEHVTKAFADNALARVARISTRIKDEGYARVFHVWDPSGVLIHFAQFANS